jgi:hypothetical protein
MTIGEPTPEQRITYLLQVAAEETRAFLGCGATIYLVRNRATGNRIPFDASGRNHWIHCPKAKELRRNTFPRGRAR